MFRNFKGATSNLILSLNTCIDNWCTKHGIHESNLSEWKQNVLKVADDKILELSRQPAYSTSSILKEHHPNNNLKDLQAKYVVTPIDKAINNAAFICQRFYAQVLVKETVIYLILTVALLRPTQILLKITTLCSRKKESHICIALQILKNTLPDQDLLSLHQNVLLNLCLMSNDKCAFFLQYEDFKNSFKQSVFDLCNQQNNSRKKVQSVSTFDFPTLHTNLKHDKLRNVLLELINFCFKGGLGNYIAVTKFGTRWVDDKKNYKIVFDKTKLKLAINYLLDNCYFTIGNSTFRRVIGIPMRSDPAPFMVNLFLYYFEDKWILKLKKPIDIRHVVLLTHFVLLV